MISKVTNSILNHSSTNEMDTCESVYLQHVSVTAVIVFRVSLHKNTINVLTAHIQEVYQVVPSLHSNSVLSKFLKSYKGRYHITS
jgi:hypothetical protein